MVKPLRRRPLIAALLAASLAAFATAAPPALAGPTRIAALTPFTANTLAELGVRPVAIGQVLGGNDRFSPRLRGVPVLTLTHPFGPNLEQLAAYNPQLVISAPVWHRGAPGMRRLGMRVAESEPRSVAAIADETERIGALVGRTRAAAALSDRRMGAIAAARRGIRRHPRVLLLLGVGRTPYAFLENSWGGDVVRQAGGRLITGGLRASGGFARISNEFVVARNPDVIIAVPHGSPAAIPRIVEYLRTNPAWRTTRAARTRQVYVSTGNSLLQPWTDADRTIADVRRKFLHN
jgi:iron complex transport system substrate-binding protein